VQQAIRQVISDPTEPLCHRYSSALAIYSYHLRHSRRQDGQVLVREPAHLLFYKIMDDDSIEILRVLHERSEFPQHIQGEA
jgi:toxin ParE1/3/4